VVYFDCPIGAAYFSQRLAKLIDYREPINTNEVTNKEYRKHYLENEPYLTFDQLIDPLTDAAKCFMANYSRPMTLVLDSIDRLAMQCPAFLERIQDFAKDCADKKYLRVVFISSDAFALPILKSQSSWTRAGAPFEIGEVDDSEAIAYLISWGVPEDQA
jgi:hypothetical protein